MWLSHKTLETNGVGGKSTFFFVESMYRVSHENLLIFILTCLVCISLELLSIEWPHCDSMWFFTWNMWFKNGHGMSFCYWSIHDSSCIWNFTHFNRILLFSFLMNCVCWGYSVMINHTGTGCDFIVSIFPNENWIF